MHLAEREAMASGNDMIWVVVDRLTKVAHFIPLKMGFTMEKLAQTYMEDGI